MRNSILEQAVKLLREKRKYRYWLTAFLCLAVLVTLGTVTVLKMNGQAMSHKEKTLDCQLEIHQHTDECYDEEHNLICGQADYVVHTHNEEDCYDENGELVCKLPEIKAHTHGPECYQEKEELVCKLEEQEEHHHTDECYTLERGDLICGQEGIFPEGEGTPAEGNTPIDENTPAAEETPAEENIPTEQIIQTEESAPTLENSPADEVLPTVEGLPEEEIVTEDGSIPEEPETGNTGGEIVEEIAGMDANAGTYEGHVHTDTCYEWKEVPTCGKEETDGHTHTDECYETKNELVCGQDEVILHTHDESCYDEEGRLTCGLLEVKEHIHGPECFKTTELTAEEVVSLNTAESEKEPEKAEEEKIVKTYKDDSINVTAEYTEFANIPDEAELVVKQITAESDPEHYAEREAAFKEEMGDEDAKMNFLLDIGFYVDGEEVEPDDTVTVKVKFADDKAFEKDKPVKMLHFAKDGTEMLEGENDEEDGVLIFKMESFSDAAIYTAAGAIQTYATNNAVSVYVYKGSKWVKAGTIPTSSIYTKNNKHAIEVNLFTDILKDYGYSVNDIDVNSSLWMGHEVNDDGKIWADVYPYTDGSETYWLFSASNSAKTFNIYYLPGNEAVLKDKGKNNDWSEYAVWDENSDRKIAINPGNGNGNNIRNEYGNVPRQIVTIPENRIDNRNATIQLPSDSQLGTLFDVDNDGIAETTIPRPTTETLYPHKLIGWYNIADKKYYSVEDGPVQAPVDLKKMNVFYADWVASSYDFDPGSETTLIASEDTNDFVTTKMFDYNELFNLHSTELIRHYINKETWKERQGFFDLDSVTKILDNGFLFLDDSKTKRGTLGAAAWLGSDYGQKELQDSKTKWGLASEQDAKLLQYLFDEENSSGSGVNYLGTGNHLYKIDTDSYYTYDSDQNAATYVQSEERFYIQGSPDKPALNIAGKDENGLHTGFFPLNDYMGNDSSRTAENGGLNYYFGMTSEIKFYLPADAGTIGSDGGYANQYNGKNMRFEFSGDDDVWVYVDDELILDIGGVHGAIPGHIDFSSGEVYVEGRGTSSIIGTKAGKQGPHTLKIYYLERGGWGSNCKIKFNIVPRYKIETPEADTVKVTKTWKNDTGREDKRPEINVALLEDGTQKETVSLNHANDWTHVWEVLDTTKKYSVQEINIPNNYEPDVSSSTQDSYDYWSEIESLDTAGTGKKIVIMDQDAQHALQVSDGNLTVKNLEKSKNSVLDSHEVDQSIQWELEAADIEGSYYLKQNGQYLSIGRGSGFNLTLLSERPSSGFKVDLINGGGLCEEDSYRIIYKDGRFQGEANQGNDGTDDTSKKWRVRVYAYQNIASKVYDFTITNTYLPNITINKVDSATSQPLSGAWFRLKQAQTDAEGNQTDTYYDGTQWTSDANSRFTINENLTLSNLPDGAYTLTEEEAPSEYQLPSETDRSISFTVSGAKITSVTPEGGIASVDESGLDLTIKNTKIGQNVQFIKVRSGREGEDSQPLTGAEFEIYRRVDTSETVIPGTENVHGEKIGETWTSETDGSFYNDTLTLGTYYLVETTPPAGYNKLSQPVMITLSIGEDDQITVTSDTEGIKINEDDPTCYKISIPNKSSYELPHTGSSGTQPFTIGGAILLLAGAFLLYGHSTRQRQRAKRSGR